MGDWVKGNQVQPSVIEADMAGLPGFDSFKGDISSCSAWSGNFGGRKKRDLGSEGEELEEVPSVMESGNGPLQWVRSLVRNVRSAEPGKEDRKGKGKKGKKGRGRKAEKGNKKGKKNANKKKRTGKGGKKGKGKGGNKKKGNGKKTRKNNKEGKNGKNNKGKGNEKKKNDKNSSKEKGRSGKDSKLLPDFLYNQLWCFDLAMEQALERCVEDKLQWKEFLELSYMDR